MEVTGKIAVKAGNGKGFKIDGQDGWFNATDTVKPYLAKMEKGDDVVVTYEKKGVSKNVTKITKAGGSPAPAEVKSEVTKGTGTPVCEDCGKELKTDKYPKCYVCGKKAFKGKAPANSYGSKSNYGTAEDIAGKEVGCAANCASTILSGRTEDPDALLELFRILSNGILEHIRALK